MSRTSLRLWLSVIALSLSAVVLAACSSSGAVMSANPAIGPNGIAPEKAKSRLLYVSDSTANTIYVYSLPSYSLIGDITDGLDQPGGIATDRHGNLYVANLSGDTVTVYSAGSASPSRTLSEPDGPVDVAVTKNGYVVAGDEDGGVDVYPPGKTSPSKRLTNPGINAVFGVGVDAHDNAYAVGLLIDGSSSTPATVEFKKLKGKGTNLRLEDLFRPEGVLVDDKANVVVSDDGDSEILVYPPGSKTPSTTFAAPQAGPSALNKSENLFYASEGTYEDQVGVYDYPSGTLVKELSFGTDYIGGTAVSPAAKP
jgi:SMP-30/Gluconolactonase/LRE-like region